MRWNDVDDASNKWVSLIFAFKAISDKFASENLNIVRLCLTHRSVWSHSLLPFFSLTLATTRFTTRFVAAKLFFYLHIFCILHKSNLWIHVSFSWLHWHNVCTHTHTHVSRRCSGKAVQTLKISAVLHCVCICILNCVGELSKVICLKFQFPSGCLSIEIIFSGFGIYRLL